MPGKYYSKELKEEMIGKIKTEGITAVEAAKRFGVDVNNIYRWVSSGVGGARGNLWEINRLKKENRQLKQIIGEMMFENHKGKKIEIMRTLTTKVNKTKLARELGVSRQSLYYKKTKEETDLELKRQIEAVMVDHKDYGHKRIALDLKMGHNRIRRVMKKYSLKPYRRRAKRWIKKKDQGRLSSGIPNLVQPLLDKKLLVKPNQIWCTDFTYIRFQGKFIYLATIIDFFTREVVGVNILRFHNRFLVIGALEDALINHGVPEIVHSDQGSEYDSLDFIAFVKIIGAKISMSEKASPWQNGHQESFFGHFKLEAGDLNRFESLGELIEYIYQQIYYYNYKRIHSVLKMTPVEFRKRHTV